MSKVFSECGTEIFFSRLPTVTEKMSKISTSDDANYPVSMFLFCFRYSFIYLLFFCPNWNRS